MRWQSDYSGALELGASYTSDDNFMFGQYNGLHEKGANLIGNLRWDNFRNMDSHWRASVSNLGLDTREGRFVWGLHDRFKVRLELDSQLQVRNNSGRTPFRGDTRLQLPGDWVSGLTTADWTALGDSLQDFDRELERDRYTLGLEAALGANWSADVELRYEDKQGVADTAGAIYLDAASGDSVLLPAPVDYRTTEFEVGLAYSGDRLHLQGRLDWSDFDNRDRQLSWQNPYSSFRPGVRYPDGEGALGLAPDSERAGGRLTGQYLFSRRTRLQFDGSYAVTTQDQAFLDYTVNPALQVNEPPPRNNLDGEVTTSTFNARLITRPLADWDLEAWYKLRDRDYDNPRDGYRYPRGDAGSQPRQARTVYNTAHDLLLQTAGLEVATRLPLRSRLSLGFEYEQAERRNAATEKTEEDRYSLGYRIRPLESLNLRFDLLYADRAADTYHWDQRYYALLDTELINATPDNQRYINHPEFSQYYLSNRERWEGKFDLNYLPAPDWNVNLNLLWREDDFDKSELGLLDSEWQRLHLSTSYAATRSLSATLYAGLDRYSSGQAGRAFRGGQEKDAFDIYPPLPQASDPSRNWDLDTRDRSVTVGAGLNWQPAEDLELVLDYSYVETNSEQDLRSYGADDLDPQDLPEVETRLHHLETRGSWHVREYLSLTLQYQYYRYSSDDWARRDLQPDTLGKVLSFGERNPNEKIHYMGLSVVYRWQ